MYDLYTQATPNGYKISIALEELDQPYRSYAVELGQGEQFSAWFKKMNPNSKIPVLYDRESDRALWESNAILLYLAQKHDALFPRPDEGDAYWEGLERLFFQAASTGPMLGQFAHFAFLASETVPYGIQRFEKETRRLLGVLDTLLAGRSYLLGERYSICDITHFPWIYATWMMGEPVDRHPNLLAWVTRIRDRPAVQAGLAVPKAMDVSELPERKRAS